jgi:transposase
MDGSSRTDAGAKRRWRSVEERLEIVQESLAPGATVAGVARARGVNANQVFNWRLLYRRGLLGGERQPAALLPVTVTEAEAPVATPYTQAQHECAPVTAPRSTPASDVPIAAARSQGQRECAPGVGPNSTPPGTIHIQLAQARVRIEGSADAATLRAVLKALRG